MAREPIADGGAEETTTIQVRRVTRDRIERHGRKGESFDDVLTRILDEREGGRTDGGQTESGRAVDAIERVVVDPEDAVRAMQHRAQRPAVGGSEEAVLRINPERGSFPAEPKAELFYSERGNRYPPELSPKPIHIRPTELLGEPPEPAQYPSEAQYPDRGEQRALFREEFGLDRGVDIEDSEHADDWDEWWATATDVAAHEIEKAIGGTVRLGQAGPEVPVEVSDDE